MALSVAAAGWVLSADPALAQPAGSEGAATAEADDEELGPEAGAKRPAGPDDRSGHVLLHARGGFTVPFGGVSTDLAAGRVVSGGPAFGAHAGIGLSRVTVLELSGSYAALPAASGCSGCSGQSFDLGLGFVYHAAQGIAFDPWISYGVGYRRTNLSWPTDALGPDVLDGTFHGLDVARVALGGDFYPVPSFGVGAFAELDVGTYLSRPGEGAGGAAAYGFFQFGVRLAFDPVPRQSPQVPAATTGGAPRGSTAIARRGRLGP